MPATSPRRRPLTKRRHLTKWRHLTKYGVAAVLISGLLAGSTWSLVAPGSAIASEAADSPVAVRSPQPPAKCVDRYPGALQKLVRRMAQERVYYNAHREGAEATVAGLDQLLADPNAHDAIPFHQKAAAQSREVILPIIAERRGAATSAVDSFEKTFAGCFGRRADRRDFASGVKGVRSAFRDLFVAHGKLLGAVGAVVTAQSGQAHQYLTEADVEFLPVLDMFTGAARTLRGLQ